MHKTSKILPLLCIHRSFVQSLGECKKHLHYFLSMMHDNLFFDYNFYHYGSKRLKIHTQHIHDCYAL